MRTATVVGVALLVAGPLAALSGALAARGASELSRATPYLVSAGATGTALALTGSVLLSVLARRRRAGQRVAALASLAFAVGSLDGRH